MAKILPITGVAMLLVLGFSCVGMYIWFSQYMLIWYSNLPEETSYFITRTRVPWAPVVVLAIVLNWIVFFFVLLPKPAKRSASVMMRVAVVVLIGRWVDLYAMVFPTTIVTTPVFGIWEVAAICCVMGTGSLLLLRNFASMHPVPAKDPYLSESIHYHAGQCIQLTRLSRRIAASLWRVSSASAARRVPARFPRRRPSSLMDEQRLGIVEFRALILAPRPATKH